MGNRCVRWGLESPSGRTGRLGYLQQGSEFGRGQEVLGPLLPVRSTGPFAPRGLIPNINSSMARKRLEVFFLLQDQSCWGSLNSKDYL